MGSLGSYATQADVQGWTCAARQMRTEATAIDQRGSGGGKLIVPRTNPLAPGVLERVSTDQAEIDAMPDDPPGGGLRSRVVFALSADANELQVVDAANEIVDLKNADGSLRYPRVWQLLSTKSNAMVAARILSELPSSGGDGGGSGSGGGGGTFHGGGTIGGGVSGGASASFGGGV